MLESVSHAGESGDHDHSGEGSGESSDTIPASEAEGVTCHSHAVGSPSLTSRAVRKIGTLTRMGKTGCSTLRRQPRPYGRYGLLTPK